MKQSEAVKDLYMFMRALQKYRSNAMESLAPEEKPMAGELWPWVFGEKCPLPVLAKLIDRVETSGDLAPLDYYNQMVILTRFMPEVLMFLNLDRIDAGLPIIEEAGREMLAGWDPE